MDKSFIHALALAGSTLESHIAGGENRWSWGTKSRGNKTPHSCTAKRNTIARNRKANKAARKNRKRNRHG